ncbi:MAG: hypothetical protein QOJ89_1260 [bacterium]|jgi:hypothetical protein
MRRPLPRLVAIVVILTVTFMLVSKILFGGDDPKTGECVDGGGALVGCGEATALYKLVREVDDGSECPSASQKLYQLRSSLYCGVALRGGAPAPSREYVPCLLLAGAELARRPQDLAFAHGAAAAPAAKAGRQTGVVKVRGDDWRIFYVLYEGQLDPGPAAIVANPAKAVFVAYITNASEHRTQVAAATRCARGDVPAS